jgi:molybdopterin-containing oxidoreductase family iron-sulfur binding subunit
MDESLDEQQQPLDIAAIRERLAGERGKQYWRSLEQVAETPQFQKWLDDEFPNRSSLLDVDRRQFLKVMGAALALAGLAGCRKLPQEKIVPYVKNPEEIVEGKPLAYATAMTVGGFATGLLVESREGRPIKVEGNPDHPASLGATDPWAQASILTMYDPDRSQVVTNLGEVSTWEAFLVAARAGLEQQAASRGAGLRILTETVTSPTLIGQLQALLARYPAAKWHQYEPSGRDNARAGAEAAFGRIVNPVYRFDRADVILSLDADFLLEMPGSSVRYARDFIDRRRVRADRRSMNRLYVAESAYTITGAMADHRLPLRPSQVEPLARAVAAGLGLAPAGGAPAPEGVPAGWVDALVRDLQAHRGTSLVIAGETQPPAVHALAHAMNEALGNANRTVVYTAPVEANAGNQTASLRELVDDMKAGRVQMLVMLGGNPVYNAPADLEFARHLTARDGDRDRIPLRIHHGLYETKPRTCVTGTSPKAIIWKPGATPAPSTARRASCSR